MSLRTVHLMFIISVIGLFLFCAALTYQNYQTTSQIKDLGFAAGSLIFAGFFSFYFFYAFKNLKKIKSHP